MQYPRYYRYRRSPTASTEWRFSSSSNNNNNNNHTNHIRKKVDHAASFFIIVITILNVITSSNDVVVVDLLAMINSNNSKPRQQHHYRVHGYVMIPHHPTTTGTTTSSKQYYHRTHTKSSMITKTNNPTPTNERMNSMIEYNGEGMWDQEFIEEQISFVPKVQIVHHMPEPLTTATTSGTFGADVGATTYYYLLRHGQSTANVAEVISSDRFTLSYTEKHGLTELGTQQATNSSQQLFQFIQDTMRNNNNDDDDIDDSNRHRRRNRNRILFVSSPFARARQTALACLYGIQDIITQQQQHLSSSLLEVEPTVLINNLLIERYFGIYDNDELYTYGYVWPLDQMNVTHTTYHVESVAAVATRIYQSIQQIHDYMTTTITSNNNSKKKQNHIITNHIVLVSHGDVVQIAQLYAANVSNVGEFSSYRFQNGEIRPMLFGDTSALPPPIPLELPASLPTTTPS